MDLIYYVIICDVVLIFIGFLINCVIDRLHKNVEETVGFLRSMGEDLDVIIKDLKEMNMILGDKSTKLDCMIDKIKETGIENVEI